MSHPPRPSNMCRATTQYSNFRPGRPSLSPTPRTAENDKRQLSWANVSRSRVIATLSVPQTETVTEGGDAWSRAIFGAEERDASTRFNHITAHWHVDAKSPRNIIRGLKSYFLEPKTYNTAAQKQTNAINPTRYGFMTQLPKLENQKFSYPSRKLIYIYYNKSIFCKVLFLLNEEYVLQIPTWNDHCYSSNYSNLMLLIHLE